MARGTSLNLSERWASAGVEQGDVLLLHTSLKRTLTSDDAREEGLTPDDVLQSFLDALGAEGTLLVPLFNFDFCDGVGFDYWNTPSRMGEFTECARRRKGSVRTGHPVYSFAVLGARAEEFSHVDNQSGYGSDSPFALLMEMGGKIGILDLQENDSMTFYHFVEESIGVDYRYLKSFTANYTDRDGKTSLKAYSINVRDIEHGVETAVNPAGEILWESGAFSGERPGTGSGLRVAKASVVFGITSEIIRSGRAEGTLFNRTVFRN